MSRLTSKFALVAALLCGWNANASAYPTRDAGRLGPPVPSASALADTAPALAPMAFVQFCLSYREQCAQPASASVMTLDGESWDNLRRVNNEVNDTIAPDASKGGYDWSLETRLGNCNDYAVQKRNALIKLGYPMAALSLAVVRTSFGEGHLVLTVRTDRGDFVLDNRRSAIVAWNRTGYSWLKRQSAENPLNWVTLLGTAAPSTQLASAAKGRTSQAPVSSADATAASEATAMLPLPSIGIAAKRLDASTAPAWQGAGSINATISHVAAGRQVAMLAFDELGRWSL